MKRDLTELVSDFLDLRDVAASLKCSSRHARRLAEAGEIPRFQKFGRLLRWNRREWEAWVAAGCPNLSEKVEE
ncbi:MAG: helix-turn-helix transcriptional regulator [Gemmataceae bacterium]